MAEIVFDDFSNAIQYVILVVALLFLVGVGRVLLTITRKKGPAGGMPLLPGEPVRPVAVESKASDAPVLPSVLSLEPIGGPSTATSPAVPLDRSVRIFLSSTFLDFGEERDLLVRQVFPKLRSRLKDRLVDVVDVDLRWGITHEQVERGETLPICLAEIDRARPFFVSLLGERYGWVPTPDRYAPTLIEQQPWLEQHRGGRSVTELEVLHGVLNNPQMAGRALFYFRAPAYAAMKGGDYLAASPEDGARQANLKARIKASGLPVVEHYATPEAFAERLEADLWSILDQAYPADEIPDPFVLDERRHDAYAAPRRRLYLGGDRYLSAFEDALASDEQRILIEGQSGGGKSALIANWARRHLERHPSDLVHVHYLAATTDAADPVDIARRIIQRIKRVTESEVEIETERDKLLESLPVWLQTASTHAQREGRRWLILLDGLNGLRDMRDLRWFPQVVPNGLHLIVSCLPGDVHGRLVEKHAWHRIEVAPLTMAEARDLLVRYLALYNKTLTPDQIDRIMAHALATNPLFLRTLAEELRVFGLFTELENRLAYYLQSTTVGDLFERVLERVEGDCGRDAVERAMVGIWASRRGLGDEEIQGIAELTPAGWAAIRYALDESIVSIDGRLTFAHDYLRIAVSDRYVAGNGELALETQSPAARDRRRQAHMTVGEWFAGREIDARAADEMPWQWQQAEAWDRLHATLTDRRMFEAIVNSVDDHEPELMRYWLAFEAATGQKLESAYEAALTAWGMEADTKKTAWICGFLAKFLWYAARYDPLAEQLYRRALAINEALHGPDHSDVATGLNNLGGLLRATNRLEEAEPLYRRALAISEARYGPDHPDVATSLNNLAGILWATNRLTEAEPLYRRALSISEVSYGPEHPTVATVLNNLAQLLRTTNRLTEAEPLYRRVLAILEASLGAEHPQVAGSLNNLAGLFRATNRPTEAEPLYRRAVAISEASYGPDHPDVARNLSNLALVLQETKRLAEAEPLMRRALVIHEASLGPDHPSVATDLNNLAVLLNASNRLTEAEPFARRALAISEASYGPDHPTVAIRLNSLGLVLKATNRPGEAEPLYRRALAIFEASLGPEHPDVATSLHNLAVLLSETNRLAEAEPLLRRVLKIVEASYGPDHPTVAIRLVNLAQLLEATNRLTEAEPFFRRALAIHEVTLGPDHPGVASDLHNLADLLRATNRLTEAEPLYRRALEIFETSLGPEHSSVATSLNNLANLLCLTNRFTEAEPLYHRALYIDVLTYGPDHSHLATGLKNLAALLRATSQLAKAEPLLRRVLAIGEATYGPDDPHVANDLNNLAGLLRAASRLGEAEPLYRRALAITEANLGPEHPHVAACLNNLAVLLSETNRLAEAEPILRRVLKIVEASYGPHDPDTKRVRGNLASLLDKLA